MHLLKIVFRIKAFLELSRFKRKNVFLGFILKKCILFRNFSAGVKIHNGVRLWNTVDFSMKKHHSMKKNNKKTLKWNIAVLL